MNNNSIKMYLKKGLKNWIKKGIAYIIKSIMS